MPAGVSAVNSSLENPLSHKPDNDDPVEITVDEVVKLTDKAALFAIDGEKHWIPYSQITEPDVDSIDIGDFDLIVHIPRWLAEDRGITHQEI